MPRSFQQPHGVTAVLHNGFRVPCAVLPDGRDHGGWPKYRCVAEVDWVNYRVVRMEVAHWPEGTSLALDVPGMSPGEAQKYAREIEWVEI